MHFGSNVRTLMYTQVWTLYAVNADIFSLFTVVCAVSMVAVNRNILLFETCKVLKTRSQWPRGVRRGSAAARRLGFWVRIPP